MAVVISGGRPRHVGAKGWPFPSRSALPSAQQRSIDLLHGGLSASFRGIVRSQPWVYAAVTRLTFWTARVPMKCYDGELSDSRQRLFDGPLPNLLKRPYKRGRQVHLMLALASDFYTYGNFLAVKYRSSPGAPPSELWPVPWRFVHKVVDEAERLVGFNVVIGGASYGLTPHDVVYQQYPDGIPPLEALARTVQGEDAAMTYQAEMLRSGITPRAAFTTAEKLGDRELTRLRAELRKLYGGPDAAGEFAILHDGLRYDKPIGISPRQLGVDDMRKMGREEVAAAFDVSPPFLGILDRATFSNVTELREALYVDSLGPKLELWQATFQAQLVDDEPAWADGGLYVEHDIGAILKPNPEGQARQALMEQQSSTTTIDERRRQRNLRPLAVPGVTDTVLVPVNMMPAGGTPLSAGEDGQASAGTLTDDLTAEAFRHGTGKRPGEGDDYAD